MPHILGSWKWCKWLCLVIASSPVPSPWGGEGPGDEASLVTASNGHSFLLCTFTVLLLFLFFILWPQNSVCLWLCSRTGIVHQSPCCWVPLQGRLSGLYRAYFSSGRPPPQHGTCHVPLITSERWKCVTETKFDSCSASLQGLRMRSGSHVYLDVTCLVERSAICTSWWCSCNKICSHRRERWDFSSFCYLVYVSALWTGLQVSVSDHVT